MTRQNQNWRRFSRLAALVLLVSSLVPGARAADEITAVAVVEKNQVFVGEPFLMQIRVDGSETPEQPVLGAMPGVTVQEMGGAQNSSQSVTIINGRMQSVVKKAYVYSYRLVATTAGEFTIPAATVRAEGQTLHTQPVRMRAVPPRESKDFKLRLSLSANKVYVGQPVIMTVTWYVGKNVNNFVFNVPAAFDNRFQITDPKITPDPNRHLQLALGNSQVIAERGQETLDGRQFVTVRFRKIMIPKVSGDITLEQATVAGQAVTGYQRRRSLMDDFFSDEFFGRGRQPVTESFVVPSNQPRLRVLDLPPAGRPSDFSGLVGEFKIEAEASPTEVNVGDPITVAIKVSGPSYLGNVELPPLANQPDLARDFMIPKERASGVVQGRAKRFTQTLRAKHSDVTAVPPIQLAYFNPKTASYEIARTDPIPLTVHGTRVLTARDAEGLEQAPAAQSGIESAEGGIAYNYEGPDVLENQAYGPAVWLRNPVWLAGLALPPLFYLGLLAFTFYGRWREADPVARRSRQALRRFSKAVGVLQPGDTDEYYAGLLDALRGYLGDKLGVTAAALIFADAAPALEEKGVGEDTIASLKHIFERLEAGRYAGASLGTENPAELRDLTREAVRKIEEVLG